jgi:hypothetical protein
VSTVYFTVYFTAAGFSPKCRQWCSIASSERPFVSGTKAYQKMKAATQMPAYSQKVLAGPAWFRLTGTG